jgi:hypothetical protein
MDGCEYDGLFFAGFVLNNFFNLDALWMRLYRFSAGAGVEDRP